MTEPENDLFAPKDGETSTAGLDTGSAEATSTGLGTDDALGSTLGSAAGLGSDEGAASRLGAQANGASSLGSDPSDAGLRTGAMPASTIGGQSLLMENDNATSNSNVGGAQVGTVGNADDAGNSGAGI